MSLVAPELDFVTEIVGPSGSIGFEMEIVVLLLPSEDPSVLVFVWSVFGGFTLRFMLKEIVLSPGLGLE